MSHAQVSSRKFFTISPDTNAGCPISDIVDEIKHSTGFGGPRSHAREPLSDHAVTTIWRWVTARDDVSVGADRKYNSVDLADLIVSHGGSVPNCDSSIKGMEKPGCKEPREIQGDDADHPRASSSIRVRVAENTMWEAITGHVVNYKKVPRSEWLLLLGIASTKSEGILQGDLGRLVDQDKRSVPKRTDALVRKGYIVKRTTLVRGTKTSKLWLKIFAPPLPKEGDDSKAAQEAEINLSHQNLAADLNQVPWHTRWTGESMDFHALATTIMAITKEWQVIRLQDLKAKLGVLRLRWQMKIVSKICRFLNSCGAIQYVAAKLDEKIYKDCIRYCRDLSPKDWSAFLATGKRGLKPVKTSLLGLSERRDQDCTTEFSHVNGSSFQDCPPWVLDYPLPQKIAKAAFSSGTIGLTNPEIYVLTLGSSFNRYVSSMTSCMSTSSVQPSFLRHLQLRNEHIRVGKVASYRFYVRGASSSSENDNARVQESDNHPGRPAAPLQVSRIFSSLSPEPKFVNKSMTISSICGLSTTMVASQRETRGKGRPKRKRPVLEAKAAEEAQTTANRLPVQHLQTNTECSRSFLVTMHVSKNALRSLRATNPTSYTPRYDRPPSPAKTEDFSKRAASSAHSNVPESTDASTTKAHRGKSRGRPSLLRNGDEGAGSRPWTCELCGGSWKNDLGLKYHLEKSKTSCNKYYDPAVDRPRLRSRRSPLVEASKRLEEDLNMRPERPKNPENLAREYLSSEIGRRHASAGFREASACPASSTTLASTAVTHTETHKLKTGMPPSSSVKAMKRPATRPNEAIKSNWSPDDSLLLPSTENRHGPSLSMQKQRLFAARKRKRVRGDKPTDQLNVKAPSCDAIMPADNRIEMAEQAYRISEAQPAREAGEIDLAKSEAKKAKKRDRHIIIGEVIEDMLHQHHGVLLGGKSLWHSILGPWAVEKPGETVPTHTELQTTVNRLLREKAIFEHWHVFRNPSGFFSKCQLLLLPGIDALSSEAMTLLETVKISEISTFEESASRQALKTSSAETKSGGRGRRLLAEEVAVLHAPVYAAQVAAKKENVSGIPGRMKRQRQAEVDVSLDTTNFFRVPKRRKIKAQASSGWLFACERTDAEKRHSTREVSQSLNLRFLEPNTFLGEDELDCSQSVEKLKPAVRPLMEAIISEGQAVYFCETREVHFTEKAITTLVGHNGTWPFANDKFFEDAGASFTIHGWMPDPLWFEWETRARALEKKTASQIAGEKCTSPVLRRLYSDFVNRLRMCYEMEVAWSPSAFNTAHHSAGPHNIFVNFESQPIKGEASAWTGLNWPREWQLTQTSIDTRALTAGRGDDISSCDDEFSSAQNVPSADGIYTNSPILHVRSPLPAKPKNVALTTRTLTSLNVSSPFPNSQEEHPDNYPFDSPDELMAAFIAVRALIGGADKAIDWGLLLAIFPGASLRRLRKFWCNAKKRQGPYIASFTKTFQDRLVNAFERNELAMIDFGDPQAYDWRKLIRWTMGLPRREGFRVPTTRERMDNRFSLEDVREGSDDWRERFFSTQASIFSRFEAVTSVPGALELDTDSSITEDLGCMAKLDIAKSWVKSLCGTEDSTYSVEIIRDKIVTLWPGNQRRTSMLLKEAIRQLTKQRIICRSKKPPLGGRPYRLNEGYISTLAKMAQSSKYDEAASFKLTLDTAFREGGPFTIPYTLTDGAMMALTNLNAAGRIKLIAMDLPNIPFGFEPGNYESRKYSKSYYHFGLQVVPEETYLFNEDIRVLTTARNASPPLSGHDGELPQWVDIFGKPNRARWSNIVGAFCFAMATRGSMGIEGICSALSPVLERFEARLILSWGQEVGIFTEFPSNMGSMMGEWWWLMVPGLRTALTRG
ncbi:B-block binding subunit of TFIIIC [Moelleriella libera RCEF 2490]|uniref:B-block binding subunit of TFIIIC n=1 Tax=Moelleriella libera RCEF 2490 TaxID=1081109 RepID=A0A167XCI8_9HYPO|nr:B-block binding subunit of TFIIIC [Moelleriella libera RCEF 2490]